LAYSFTPPTRTLRPGRTPGQDRLTMRLHLTVGVSVLKEDGFYSEVIEPTAERIAAADVAYIGGRSYTIDSTERAALIANGYGSYITGAP
jgi:hypothetical protein